MSVLRTALIVIIASAFGWSFTVLTPDVPETAYDESEFLPCENTPALSSAFSEIIFRKGAVHRLPLGVYLSFRGKAGVQFAEQMDPQFMVCDARNLTLLTLSRRC